MFPHLARRDRIDVFHEPGYFVPLAMPCPTVVTVHDVRSIVCPGLSPVLRGLAMRITLAKTLRRVTRIIAVSNFTKSELLRTYDLDESKITVVHHGCDPAFSREPDPAEVARVRAKYGLPDRFVLTVGRHEPRKNQPRLVEAFSRLRSQGCAHGLVIAGEESFGSAALYRAIEAFHAGPYVRVLGQVHDRDLPCLYHLADAFVFPSLYEGFGIPLLEAFHAGVPVIASHVCSHEEIAAGAALLCDPMGCQDMAAAMDRVLSSPGEAAELVRRGRLRAGAFAWQRTAQATLRVYERAVACA
jgi:glycosyltransferase involved in cell wall biosynthesis